MLNSYSRIPLAQVISTVDNANKRISTDLKTSKGFPKMPRMQILISVEMLM